MKLIYIKIKNKIKGFTLIEALVYSTLLSMFLFSSILFASNIISANTKVTEQNELLVNQEFLEKKLNWIVGQSNAITVPASGASGSTLTLTGTNPSLFPATFSLVNNQILISLPGEPNIPLTNNRVKVSTFSIVHLSSLASIPAIRVTLASSSVNLPTMISTTNLSYVLSK